MNLNLIGQLLEVKPVEYTNKKTEKVSYSTDLTIMFGMSGMSPIN